MGSARGSIEFYRVVFRKRIYPTLEELQGDLDRWLTAYNGARLAADICDAIKREFNVSIYVLIVPPDDLDDLPRLRESRRRRAGMNVELFSEQGLRDYAPGKEGRCRSSQGRQCRWSCR